MEISRARDRAELVTDDAKALREQLEAATWERFSALEGIGEMSRGVAGKTAETELYDDREFGDRSERNTVKDRKGPELERGRGAEMDLGL